LPVIYTVHILRSHFILLSAAWFCMPAALAFDLNEQPNPQNAQDAQNAQAAERQQSLHGNIIQESLSSTFAPDNLNLIIKSCDQADDADLLFQKNSIKRGLSYIEREQKKALNAAYAADRNPAYRFTTLKHFGYMLRASQDFYSNSNYVELQVERLTNKFGNNNFDPYTIDLVDWNHVGTSQNSALSEAGKLKNNARQGQETIGQSTYYKTARELALRETARQWDVFSTLIKSRYPSRAQFIITALKEASVPEQEAEFF